MNSENSKTAGNMEFPYIEILKRAAKLVWENKFLLWFGVLMALGTPGSFNIGGNKSDWGEKGDIAKKFLETHWQIVLAISFVLFLIGIALFLLSLLGRAGLVNSVQNVEKNQPADFKTGWLSAKPNLWKLFGLSILTGLIVLAILLVLGVPVAYLIFQKSWVGAVAVGLLAIAIFIPLAIVVSLTKLFAEFYIILSKLRILSAIEAGYSLLSQNFLKTIVFGLLLFAVSVAAGIILIPVAAIVLLVLVPAGILFWALGKIVFGIFIGIAIILFLAALLFVSSIFITFKTTAWTLFFREIAKVEKPETEAVTEEELKKEIVATPASPSASLKGESLGGPEKA